MKLADVNGDGMLSYEELVMTSVQRKLQNKEERLWEAFCKFDKDLDGSITAAEIAEVLKVSKTEAEALIKEIDKNGDNMVDYDEFSAMMMAREEQGISGCKRYCQYVGQEHLVVFLAICDLYFVLKFLEAQRQPKA